MAVQLNEISWSKFNLVQRNSAWTRFNTWSRFSWTKIMNDVGATHPKRLTVWLVDNFSNSTNKYFSYLVRQSFFAEDILASSSGFNYCITQNKTPSYLTTTTTNTVAASYGTTTTFASAELPYFGKDVSVTLVHKSKLLGKVSTDFSYGMLHKFISTKLLVLHFSQDNTK